MRSKSAHVRRVKRRHPSGRTFSTASRAARPRESLARGWNNPPVVHDASQSSHRGRRRDTRDGAGDSRCGTVFEFFALNRFNQQIASYMTMRNEVQDRVGVPPTSSNSPISSRCNPLSLTASVRRARKQTGDIFNADIGYEFRRRIQHALQSHGLSEGGLLADLRRDSRLILHGWPSTELRLEIRRDDATVHH
jgi:hypothetical protein